MGIASPILSKQRYSPRAFTDLEGLVVLVLFAILALLLVPNIRGPHPGKGWSQLMNAKQIYLAIYQMAADHALTDDPLLGWPGDLALAKVRPVSSLPEFVERMMELDYMKRTEVGKVFTAPGLSMYPGKGSFLSKDSAFKIYKVTEQDDSRCVLVASRNFTFGKGLDSTKLPYGDRFGVIVRKGGDGLPLNAQQAAHTALVGFMPGATTQAEPGEEEGNLCD